MGSSTSKPSNPKEHVFTAETPVRFSPDLLQALEQSPESDNTRASDLELHIQRRVATELARLEAQTDASLKALSENPPTSPPSLFSNGGGADQNAKDAAQADKMRDLGRESVQKEIETVKAKLQQRRMREDVVGDKKVEAAREKVVQCLRVNDRRPLDCWKEVEGFKREVGRLEGEFLGRVVD